MTSTITRAITRERTIRHTSLWIAAVSVGLAAVAYARAVAVVQRFYFRLFEQYPWAVTIAAPLFFVLATALVRRFAPDAKGSGIPQVLEAIHEGQKDLNDAKPWHSSLVSLRTAGVKVLSSLVGLLGGASIGREGPTVQISASVFAAIGRVTRKYTPNVTLPSYLTAGAAAGVAAAFNTPIAGITFAIEEVIEGAIGAFRQTMMIAVILAGITAQALLGNYLYFGSPAVQSPGLQVIYQSLLIGLVGGACGGIFSRILAYPQLTRLPKHWVLRALVCGMVSAAIGWISRGDSAGSGYEATRHVLMAQSMEGASVFAPIYKMVSTVLSYLSGMAGGIFSPSLSIGAGVGVSIAKILHFANFRACALMGMVAFFSGVVQAPLTAVIIVTEMTDRHILILPFMVAAFVGQTAGRMIMPVPLYHFLARRHLEG